MNCKLNKAEEATYDVVVGAGIVEGSKEATYALACWLVKRQLYETKRRVHLSITDKSIVIKFLRLGDWSFLCMGDDELSVVSKAKNLLSHISCKTCGERGGDCAGETEKCVGCGHKDWRPE